jgi:hypothetical protein
MRLSGTLFGLGLLLFGAFAVIGPGAPVAEATRQDASWFGAHLIVGGALALLASWIPKNLDGIWCRRPRRWGAGRSDDHR